MILKFLGLNLSSAPSAKDAGGERELRHAFVSILDCLSAGRFECAKAAALKSGLVEIIPYIEVIQGAAQTMLADSVDLSMHINESCHIGAKLNKISREINDRSEVMADTIARFSAIPHESRNGAGVGMESMSAIDRINHVVGLTQERVTDLVSSTEEIKRILSIISSISNQTKLLSLNATIEAARAGDAGRGFSVVAGEVKKLAEETASSAEDIQRRIDSLSSITHDISTRMQEVGSTVKMGMEEQQTAVSDISQGVVEIAALTGESVLLINKTLETIDLSEGVVSKCLAHFSGYELEHLMVQVAKSDHAIWKKRLSSMILGRVRMNADELADHTKCHLGKWYYSDASELYQSNPAFRGIEKAHIDVHKYGIAAVERYNAGDMEGALEEIEKVEQSSRIVLQKLQELHS